MGVGAEQVRAALGARRHWFTSALCSLAGAASLLLGLWLIYPPAAFVLGGLLLLVFGLLREVRP